MMVRWALCGSVRTTSPSRRIPENAPALRHTTGGTAQRSRPLSTDDSIPFGYCHCGCGVKTTVPRTNNVSVGYAKGAPMRYLHGHNMRKSAVDFIEDENGCWVWQLSSNMSGYGTVRSSGKTIPAHRHIYETQIGPVPEGMVLDHLCRNRKCVNPDHLEPVTHAENVQRGDTTRLNSEDAREIFLAKGEIPATKLAAQYGVGILSIYRIWRRQTWKNVTAGLAA